MIAVVLSAVNHLATALVSGRL